MLKGELGGGAPISFRVAALREQGVVQDATAERDDVAAHGRPLRLLVLARNYPNNVLPRLGLWTQRLVQCVTDFADVKVVSPVPYAPPLPGVGGLAYYARFRQLRPRWYDGAVEVLHPRLLTGPGYSLHNVEAVTYALAVLPSVHQLRRRFPFELIHAHFTYPDGVVASMIGRLYGVPVVITEHVPWLPWLQQYPLVRRQAVWASRACAAHIAVSESVRQGIVKVTGDAAKVRVIPNVVDDSVFQLADGQRRVPGQVLFVGAVRFCKGVDVLLEALGALRRSHPGVRLILAGEAFYQSYRREVERLQEIARTLSVADCVAMVGDKAPAEVAELMAQSAVVVLPSRAESFGAVLIEAMACGTPVVATRCGGPEEIITPAVGHLVPPEDPAALAAALADVLDHLERYDPAALRRYALSRYSTRVVAQQLAAEYGTVLQDPGLGFAGGK